MFVVDVYFYHMDFTLKYFPIQQSISSDHTQINRFQNRFVYYLIICMCFIGEKYLAIFSIRMKFTKTKKTDVYQKLALLVFLISERERERES